MPDDKNKTVPDGTATVEAAQTAERERVASVIAACKGHDDIMAQAVKEGWTAEKAELACLKAEKAAAEKAKIEAGRPGAPARFVRPARLGAAGYSVPKPRSRSPCRAAIGSGGFSRALAFHPRTQRVKSSWIPSARA